MNPKMYRAAYEYHMRNAPPMVDREYWQSHVPGEADIPRTEEAYWDRANRDMLETCAAHDNNPLLSGLLCAIYDDLMRDYEAGRRESNREHRANAAKTA